MTSTTTETTFVAIHPTTGAHVRAATGAEVAAFHAGQTNPHYRVERPCVFGEPVRVGDVLIDTYTGPGAWFGGAGF